MMYLAICAAVHSIRKSALHSALSTRISLTPGKTSICSVRSYILRQTGTDEFESSTLRSEWRVWQTMYSGFRISMQQRLGWLKIVSTSVSRGLIKRTINVLDRSCRFCRCPSCPSYQRRAHQSMRHVATSISTNVRRRNLSDAGKPRFYCIVFCQPHTTKR